jgi:phage terminase large subunit-like protein
MAANYTFLRTIADRVIVWLHGRRIGLFGDGQASVNNSLVIDGVTVGSTRTGANPIKAVAAGSNGAGAITVTGTLVGDIVEIVVQISGTQADSSSSFETTVTVAGQVQQTSASNLSGNTYLFFVNPQAAA